MAALNNGRHDRPEQGPGSDHDQRDADHADLAGCTLLLKEISGRSRKSCRAAAVDPPRAVRASRETRDYASTDGGGGGGGAGGATGDGVTSIVPGGGGGGRFFLKIATPMRPPSRPNMRVHDDREHQAESAARRRCSSGPLHHLARFRRHVRVARRGCAPSTPAALARTSSGTGSTGRRATNAPISPGHEPDDRALGRVDLKGSVLLAQVGRQRPADEDPQTAAAVPGVDQRQC